jgi:hypothetical protein
MKTVALFLAAAVIAFVLSCAPSISVNHDYDPDYNYTNLKTYAWIPVQGAAQVSELKIKRFQNAVDTELAARGMQQSSENPDFLSALHGMAQNKVNVTDWGYSYGRYWAAGPRNIDVDTYQEGTVFLDFVDAKSKELFWRGAGTSVIEPGISPEKQEGKFAAAAAKLLAGFPPTAQ